MNAPTTMPDGIYFRMPMDDYLALERVSKSAIKKIRISPADWWADSWLNPDKEDLTPEQERRRKAAAMLGRAYHAARLEPEIFAATYVREPGQEEMPEGSLFTSTEIKEVLKEKGLKMSGAVLEQATRLHEEGGFPREKLWHLVLADFEREVESWDEPPTRLSPIDFDRIAEDGRRLRSVEGIPELISGGAAEVSVLYTCPETGIPMKVRFDYLRADGWTELKTFSNPNGKALEQCLMDAFRFNRYHIDAVGYLQGIQAIHSGELEIQGECTDAEGKLIAGLVESGGDRCDFIFQQTGSVPNILHRPVRLFTSKSYAETIKELEADGASEEHLERARNFQRIAEKDGGDGRAKSAVHIKAAMEIREAKRAYLAYSEIYDRGEPWLPFNPTREITDDDFHPNWLESV